MDYDIITVGGGLGGAALARAMAERGAEGRSEELRARVGVGAGGRGSTERKWAGFDVRRDPERLLFSGVLMDDVGTPDDAATTAFDPGAGRISLLFPQGRGRARAY